MANRRTAIAVTGVAVIVGCGLVGGGWLGSAGWWTLVDGGSGSWFGHDEARLTDEEVRHAADATAAEVRDALRDGPSVNADELAWQAGRAGVTIMEVRGEVRHESPGVRLVIRVPDPRSPTNGTAVPAGLCYRLLIDDSAREYSATAVPCPEREPRELHRPVSPLAGVEDHLLDELGELSEQSRIDLEEFTAMIDGLELDPERVRVDQHRSGSAIGVGLRVINAQVECILARVEPGSAEVWSPPRRQLQPGELACQGREALARYGQR